MNHFAEEKNHAAVWLREVQSYHIRQWKMIGYELVLMNVSIVLSN